MNWTEDRVAEFKRLQTMLYEINTLNLGSGCIERLQRICAIANDLTDTDINTGRLSLERFMVDLIIKDWEQK